VEVQHDVRKVRLTRAHALRLRCHLQCY
jgi:hypothetical protein